MIFHDDGRMGEVDEEFAERFRRTGLRDRGDALAHCVQTHVRCEELIHALVDRTGFRGTGTV